MADDLKAVMQRHSSALLENTLRHP
jgi:hypothetical protein